MLSQCQPIHHHVTMHSYNTHIHTVIHTRFVCYEVISKDSETQHDYEGISNSEVMLNFILAQSNRSV